jgi:hypothetical protein
MFSKRANEISNPCHKSVISRKQLQMPLALFGIIVQLLAHLAYLGSLRKVIFEREVA